MRHRELFTIAVCCIATSLYAQGHQSPNVPDQKKVLSAANRALAVLELKAQVGTLESSATNPSNVFVMFKEATMLVDHVRELVVYAANETLRREMSKRLIDQPIMRRSDEKWAEMGLAISKKLWPSAKLTLKKVTRYPEEAANRITGQRSSRSNSINLEYRGSIGPWKVRADVVFDQVTGKVAVVRLGDEPKPR